MTDRSGLIADLMEGRPWVRSVIGSLSRTAGWVLHGLMIIAAAVIVDLLVKEYPIFADPAVTSEFATAANIAAKEGQLEAARRDLLFSSMSHQRDDVLVDAARVNDVYDGFLSSHFQYLFALGDAGRLATQIRDNGLPRAKALKALGDAATLTMDSSTRLAGCIDHHVIEQVAKARFAAKVQQEGGADAGLLGEAGLEAFDPTSIACPREKGSGFTFRSEQGFHDRCLKHLNASFGRAIGYLRRERPVSLIDVGKERLNRALTWLRFAVRGQSPPDRRLRERRFWEDLPALTFGRDGACERRPEDNAIPKPSPRRDLRSDTVAEDEPVEDPPAQDEAQASAESGEAAIEPQAAPPAQVPAPAPVTHRVHTAMSRAIVRALQSGDGERWRTGQGQAGIVKVSEARLYPGEECRNVVVHLQVRDQYWPSRDFKACRERGKFAWTGIPPDLTFYPPSAAAPANRPLGSVR